MSAGIPGTGIGYQQRINSRPRQGRADFQRHGPAETGNVSVVFSLDEEGKVLATRDDGTPLEAKYRRLAFEQNGAKIEQWLRVEIHEINELSTRLGRIHQKTPPPVYRSRFKEAEFPQRRPKKPERVEFSEAEPTAPAPLKAGILDKVVPGRARRRESKREEELARHEEELAEWGRAKKLHDERQLEKVQRFEAALEQWEEDRQAFATQAREDVARQEQRLRTDPEFMGEVLQSSLSSLEWPLETNVSFEFREGGALLMLDVDLPEVEDLPTIKASLAANKRRILKKKRSQADVRREYASHVNGIGLRLLGEAFSSLPAVEVVVISAYSQRLDRATGKVSDEYLYSAKVDRDSFGSIDFRSLTKVDPIEALAMFEIERKMSKTGLFKPIKPYSG